MPLASCLNSTVSYQPSAVSRQRSAVSGQPSAVSRQPSAVRGYLKSFFILNFAPLAPQASNPSLGGNKNQFAAKSPPSEGLLARGI
ncbi:hypothetical protein [Moorena sp. SIO3A2]|uniref:hypothetical protein n=1 Tax=Moorena sp. SIO3A2 TaxID=2607841 RepID=UPI0013BBCE82|nr:hypothetical protein [Moorena sp. SIO3A2]NER86348.1 hypothetical protein [Moorena sp. SIO3A2]